MNALVSAPSKSLVGAEVRQKTRIFNDSNLASCYDDNLPGIPGESLIWLGLSIPSFPDCTTTPVMD